MRPQKPTRLDKVLAWRQTYHEVLEELLAGFEKPPDDEFPTPIFPRPADTGLGVATLRAAAARTAAILIQGVELGHDDSGNR